MTRHRMSIAELLTQPTVLDLATAARALGLGRTSAYRLARTGRFPCRILSIGGVYRVPTAALAETLGIDPHTLHTDQAPSASVDEQPRAGVRHPRGGAPGDVAPRRPSHRPNTRARDWHERPPQREHGSPNPTIP